MRSPRKSKPVGIPKAERKSGRAGRVQTSAQVTVPEPIQEPPATDQVVTATAPTAKQKRYQDALQLLSRLCAMFPACFRPEHETPLPLAIGVRDVLREELGDGVDPRVLNFSMRLYCRRPSYREALAAPGAMRVGLDGSVVGPVTMEDRTPAK